MRISKAVFPAAGLGTRFLPATKAQPKEMLPLVDKPLIQYVIEEAVEAGIRNITIVTGRGKNAIEDHFDVSYELERVLEERGKEDLLNQAWGTPYGLLAMQSETSHSPYCSETISSTHGFHACAR